jgi:hypothetical protein
MLQSQHWLDFRRHFWIEENRTGDSRSEIAYIAAVEPRP